MSRRGPTALSTPWEVVTLYVQALTDVILCAVNGAAFVKLGVEFYRAHLDEMHPERLIGGLKLLEAMP